MYDTQLTQRMKSMAMHWGADLIGVAPAERWAKAPLEHSPRGIMPTARCAISCAVHIPDACMELGSEEDPRKPGPGLVLVNLGVTMNSLAFRLANWLEEQGWPTIAEPQTLYWNYRSQPGDSRGWKSDICSYYAAAYAGLGEIGWHNLCITPEFGARQRFVTLITEAPLAPDPLYQGPSLCLRCGTCVRNCPAKALSDQDSMAIEVEGKRFEWAAMDPLRCDWAKRYALVNAEGPGFMGSKVDFPVPDNITPEAVCNAIRNSDRLQRPGYTAIVERCFTECPVGKHPRRSVAPEQVSAQ